MKLSFMLLIFFMTFCRNIYSAEQKRTDILKKEIDKLVAELETKRIDFLKFIETKPAVNVNMINKNLPKSLLKPIVKQGKLVELGVKLPKLY